MAPESINLAFALFDCFGAILFEVLIAGLMDLFYQSDFEGTEQANVFQRNKGICTPGRASHITEAT